MCVSERRRRRVGIVDGGFVIDDEVETDVDAVGSGGLVVDVVMFVVDWLWLLYEGVL